MKSNTFFKTLMASTCIAATLFIGSSAYAAQLSDAEVTQLRAEAQQLVADKKTG
jgi:hypothetical protein